MDERSNFDQAPDVVQAVFDKHRSGGVSDVRARGAIITYITALAPEDFFSDKDLAAFEVYVDIALQSYKRATRANLSKESVGIIDALGRGEVDALKTVRQLT